MTLRWYSMKLWQCSKNLQYLFQWRHLNGLCNFQLSFTPFYYFYFSLLNEDNLKNVLGYNFTATLLAGRIFRFPLTIPGRDLIIIRPIYFSPSNDFFNFVKDYSGGNISIFSTKALEILAPWCTNLGHNEANIFFSQQLLFQQLRTFGHWAMGHPPETPLM